MSAQTTMAELWPDGLCAVAVDVALLTVRDGVLQVLLAKPDTPPFTALWSLPGRRVAADENLDETAHRALRELAGVAAPDAHLQQLRTYGDPGRDPHARIVSVAYLALTPLTDTFVLPSHAQLVPVAQLLANGANQLAYDHRQIVADALERARSKLEYSSLATAFVTEPFTLAELRRVYEAVWGVVLDEANFRRKVAHTPGFVVEVSGVAPPGPEGGRPAKRYKPGGATQLHPAMLRP
ncbi:MAG: NUDIX domain-containing protein [Nitriliruptoraceae bacterium]